MKTVLFTAAALALTATISTAEEVDDAQMLAITQSVIAGITGEAPATPEAEGGDLSTLISQALEQGQSDDYMAALVTEAVNRGDIDVPDAMVSTDGAVDTKTLLATLVGKSLRGDSAEEELRAEALGEPANATEPRRHTVASGESLAGIALKYYGEASQYDKIFAANRDTIDRPSLIKIGQVILIP